MRLLADVNIEAMLVRWLRAEAHDVVWASELPPSIPDEKLLAMANEDGRILLTYDRDFGELVFSRRSLSEGIILLRFDAPLQAERLGLLQRHWQAIVDQASGHFLVVTDRKLRIRPIR